jgi:hypothetical protein
MPTFPELNAAYSNFPKLAYCPHRVTSAKTPQYNCIAYAMNDTARWWWPKRETRCYWPIPQREESIDNFITAFATQGFYPCPSGKFVNGVQKIVLYANGSKPTHAAKLLLSGEFKGMWSSKLGQNHDIFHCSVRCIESQFYGSATVFFAKV